MSNDSSVAAPWMSVIARLRACNELLDGLPRQVRRTAEDP